MAEDNIDDSGDSKASFNSLLQQALTLGFRKITPSKLPQFVALIIYVALTALIAGGVHFGEPIVITAGIVLLLLAAIMSLMLTLGASISPVVLNILVVVVVLGTCVNTIKTGVASS